MPLILHHQDERSSDVGCIKFECEYYDVFSEQNCSGKTWDGETAIEWCEDYKPKTTDIQ